MDDQDKGMMSPLIDMLNEVARQETGCRRSAAELRKASELLRDSGSAEVESLRSSGDTDPDTYINAVLRQGLASVSPGILLHEHDDTDD